MNKKSWLLASLALGVLISPTVVYAQYSFEQIGIPGQNSTQVFAINDSGDAVGNSFDPDSSIPFLYASMDGTLEEIMPAADYLATSVLGINDAGIIVGGVTNLDGISTSAFIRSKGGEYTVFSHPDAVSQTTARGVNNKGLVTGTRDTVDNTLAGFLYDPKTRTFTDLVTSFFSIAHGINSRGVVVGDARFLVDPCGGPDDFQRYGWVREKDGSIILFRVNGQSTRPRGVNDAGMVAGSTIDPFTFQEKGFVIKAPESNCESVSVDPSELLQFPGSDITIPEGITNSGDIVGVFSDELFNFQGFIARPQ
jgi:uncharacterized membrane protein